jgi:Tol biopolymer transport system component
MSGRADGPSSREDNVIRPTHGLGPRVLLVNASILIAVWAVASPVVAMDGRTRDRIAFASDRSGNFEIYVMNADGSGVTNLSNHAANDLFPAWSPDGKRIAFARGSGLARELYVMDRDGANQTRLTFNSVADVQPVWSPSGRELAFVRFGTDGNRDIYVMRSEPNAAARQVTADAALFDILPDWAPNDRIAFSSDRGAGSDPNAVYSVKADGTKLRLLTPPALFAGGPGWSPDGDRLVASDQFCGFCSESDIVVIDLGDGSITHVTDSPENDVDPDFSPDGRRIAYDSGTVDVPEPGDFGPPDILVVDAQGSGTAVNLTDDPLASDIQPDWEPRGA